MFVYICVSMFVFMGICVFELLCIFKYTLSCICTLECIMNYVIINVYLLFLSPLSHAYNNDCITHHVANTIISASIPWQQVNHKTIRPTTILLTYISAVYA